MTATALHSLAPELIVTDLDKSLTFYQKVGFDILFSRMEERFVYLRMGGADIMLEEVQNGSDIDWVRSALEPPYGRGINFQIEVTDVDAIHNALTAHGCTILRPMMDKTYKTSLGTIGSREFIVADPDGYALRFHQISQPKENQS